MGRNNQFFWQILDIGLPCWDKFNLNPVFAEVFQDIFLLREKASLKFWEDSLSVVEN